MNAKSCSSTITDPYRAGIEIGEGLASLQPEVIFLFPTIEYQGSPELVEGILDVLDSDDIVLIGNTGDGFYEYNKVGDSGVSALGMNSDGAVNWHIACESGVGSQPFEATERCFARLHEACKRSDPALYFLTTDFRTDTTEIIAAVQKSARGPVVGGSAGDDYTFSKCFVYANREVYTDCVAVLAVEGEIEFDILIANTMQPMGSSGKITEFEGTTIRMIDNIPAMEFVEREIGKPIVVIDQGIISLKLTEHMNDVNGRIRSVLLPDPGQDESGIKLFGGVTQGDYAQVCLTPREKIIEDVKDIAQSISNLPFNPIAALAVSCAGRKKVLAEHLDTEVSNIVDNCKSLEALAGFPSFGEFGPMKTDDGYTDSMFHNMTFILLLIGGSNN
ncbi:MAG TPA: hypothetical protein ENH10_04995 [Bacteroidetes bacterium]|nr:FIST N domain protein [bacterium BMS3Bbin04]HDO65373.1 hypothetical protein [Bacteroidota bacterium]HEX04498.1 hypothetical protein [Bacteroidota bacterium]